MSTVQNGTPASLKHDETKSNTPNGEFLALRPPCDKIQGIKNPFLLVIQVAWACLLILPSILYSLFRKIFPPAGKSFKNKVVLVTGAGRGLGRGLALRFAKEGAKVAVVDVDTTSVSLIAKEIREAGGVAKAYTTNVAEVEQIQQLRVKVTKELGTVDILVNNAGLIYGETIDNMTDKDIRGVMEVNLLSHFWMTREFLPTMKKYNSGHIVAMCSASAFAALANATAYSASKSGIIGFMDALREELRLNPENKIKTTTVCPYFINTSAEYMDHWDLRFPAITIEEVVEATVEGIRRNVVQFCIPGYLYFNIHLYKLYPQNIIDKFREIFYTRLSIPSAEEQMKSPSQRIINELKV